MRRNVGESKVTASYTIARSLKEDLKNFAKYSGATESSTIEEALLMYFKSDRGFAKLQAEEEAKREFFESLEDELGKPYSYSPNSELL